MSVASIQIETFSRQHANLSSYIIGLDTPDLNIIYRNNELYILFSTGLRLKLPFNGAYYEVDVDTVNDMIVFKFYPSIPTRFLGIIDGDYTVPAIIDTSDGAIPFIPPEPCPSSMQNPNETFRKLDDPIYDDLLDQRITQEKQEYIDAYQSLKNSHPDKQFPTINIYHDLEYIKSTYFWALQKINSENKPTMIYSRKAEVDVPPTPKFIPDEEEEYATINDENIAKTYYNKNKKDIKEFAAALEDTRNNTLFASQQYIADDFNTRPLAQQEQHDLDAYKGLKGHLKQKANEILDQRNSGYKYFDSDPNKDILVKPTLFPEAYTDQSNRDIQINPAHIIDGVKPIPSPVKQVNPLPHPNPFSQAINFSKGKTGCKTNFATRNGSYEVNPPAPIFSGPNNIFSVDYNDPFGDDFVKLPV